MKDAYVNEEDLIGAGTYGQITGGVEGNVVLLPVRHQQQREIDRAV